MCVYSEETRVFAFKIGNAMNSELTYLRKIICLKKIILSIYEFQVASHL